MPARVPMQRYDSLFQVYAEWRLDKDGHWTARTPPLDWQLLKAQAVAESNLDPNAESPVHAEGLSQFMQATFDEWAQNKWKGVPPPPQRHITPWSAEIAIWAQADTMSWLLSTFAANKRKALAAYNWGVGHVLRACDAKGEAWEQLLPDETVAYVAKILGA